MTEEDEAFEAIDKAQGWRKRQIEQELGQPIYFKPRREWVDLTEQEIKDVCYEVFNYEPYAIALAIQAKLKEKNHD